MEVKDFEKNFPVTNSDSGVLGWQNYELTFFSFFSQIFSDMIYYLFHDGKKKSSFLLSSETFKCIFSGPYFLCLPHILCMKSSQII